MGIANILHKNTELFVVGSWGDTVLVKFLFGNNFSKDYSDYFFIFSLFMNKINEPHPQASPLQKKEKEKKEEGPKLTSFLFFRNLNFLY